MIAAGAHYEYPCRHWELDEVGQPTRKRDRKAQVDKLVMDQAPVADPRLMAAG
jgi:hypothetical protein